MTSMIFPRKKGADMVMTLDTARNPTAAGKTQAALRSVGASARSRGPTSLCFSPRAAVQSTCYSWELGVSFPLFLDP